MVSIASLLWGFCLHLMRSELPQAAAVAYESGRNARNRTRWFFFLQFLSASRLNNCTSQQFNECVCAANTKHSISGDCCDRNEERNCSCPNGNVEMLFFGFVSYACSAQDLSSCIGRRNNFISFILGESGAQRSELHIA